MFFHKILNPFELTLRVLESVVCLNQFHLEFLLLLDQGWVIFLQIGCCSHNLREPSKSSYVAAIPTFPRCCGYPTARTRHATKSCTDDTPKRFRVCLSSMKHAYIHDRGIDDDFLAPRTCLDFNRLWFLFCVSMFCNAYTALQKQTLLFKCMLIHVPSHTFETHIIQLCLFL